MTTTAPYGSWRSPIDAAAVARGGRRLGAAALGADGAVWWSEGRPEEQGRVALMRRPPGGQAEEVTPAGANVRTRVHEYGGGSWALLGPERVLYAEFADQRLYLLELGAGPAALTPEPQSPAALRYADLCPTPDGDRVVCVRERHDGGEPANELVAIALADGAVEVLASGRDFYSFPRVSPDGRWLAWTCWDQPNMPWDGTELWVAPLADPGAERLVAGGREESIFQPAWDDAGRLHFVSDRDGWWNLYRSDEATELGEPGAQVALTEERADLAHPQWLFGGATYAFLEGGAIACVRTEGATERLFALKEGAWGMTDLGLPYTSFGFPVLSARGSRVAFVAASPEAGAAVVVHDTAGGTTEVVRAASERPLDPAYAPRPRAIEFPTTGGEVGHGFYYPPTNPGFEAPAGELPPLIVESHGGPTSHSTPALSAEYAFWTSRGFGVVDVNYRGSSGYGRAYRDRLQGAWGIVDSEDCVAAARYLAAQGEADGNRLAPAAKASWKTSAQRVA